SCDARSIGGNRDNGITSSADIAPRDRCADTNRLSVSEDLNFADTRWAACTSTQCDRRARTEERTRRRTCDADIRSAVNNHVYGGEVLAPSVVRSHRKQHVIAKRSILFCKNVLVA